MNIKKGIEYRPIVCYFDDDTKLMIARLGLAGYGCLQLLHNKMSMENGYYIEWNERKQSLFALDIYEKDVKVIKNCVQYCLENGIFDKEMYEKHHILTSLDIQRNYKQITQKRINQWHAPQYVYPELLDSATPTAVECGYISKNDNNSTPNRQQNNVLECENVANEHKNATPNERVLNNSQATQNNSKMTSKIQNDVNLAQTDVILGQTDDILGQTDVILKQREREEERESESKEERKEESKVKVIGERKENVSQTALSSPPSETPSVPLAQFLSQKLNKPLRNPNLVIDSNRINIESLYRAVRESVFLQNNKNLDIDWLVEHYDDVIAGKYKDFSAYKKRNPVAIRHRDYDLSDFKFSNIDDFL